jgi:hypothetical protein
VLLILKFLLLGNFNKSDFFSTNNFYLPNMLHQMRPANSLYFIDNNKLKRIINQNSEQIKSATLFDIADLTRFLENSLINHGRDEDEDDEMNVDSNESDKSNGGNILQSLGAFNQLTWPRFFRDLNLSDEQTPQPLSSVLVERVADSDSGLVKNDSITNKVHSDGFIQSVAKIVCLLNQEISQRLTEDVDFDLFVSYLADLMGRFCVYESKEIIVYYFDASTNKPVENSQRAACFACLKATMSESMSDNEPDIQFIAKRDCILNDYFYSCLAEAIVTETRGMCDAVAALRPYQNVVDKMSYRLIPLVFKLLKVNAKRFNQVIDDYSSYYFFYN